MELDDILTSQDVPHYNVLRPMLCGSFNLSQTPIPYYQTVLTLEEVSKELELVENLPSDLRSKWKLEELFQREIDWSRVENEIVNGYLRSPEKLKFFNSLTVALLPLNSQRMLDSTYGDTPHEPELRPALRVKPWQLTNVGGVQIITNPGTPNGFIRWNPKRIFAATIDGQHRLAALREHYNHGNLSAVALDSKVSVLFLVLDPRVGFDLKRMELAEDDNAILTVVREIFIDLNKHARSVERSRQILMDDHEIESRCLRELLAPRVGMTSEGRLPLGIVHWQHHVTAKFNDGKRSAPFVTTVELLYSILKDLFDLKRPTEPMDEAQVRKFVASIENALDVSNVIASSPQNYPGIKPLVTYVEKHYFTPDNEVPFVNLPAVYLRAAVDGFNMHLRPLLVGVLTRFKTYKHFIEEVNKRGGIDGDLAFYLVQPANQQKQTKDAWGDTVTAKKIDEPLEQLAAMKEDDWAFYAVFQKGLMRASAIAWRQFPVLGGKQDSTIEEFLTQWIAFLDDLTDRGLLKVAAPFGKKDKVWTGISLNLGETVRWSESAVQRIASLLVIWWYFHTSAKSKVGSFLKKIAGPRSNETLPKAKELLSALSKGLKAMVARTDEEIEEDEINKRVDKRLRDLILLAINKATTDEGTDEEEDTEGTVSTVELPAPAEDEEESEGAE